MKQFKNIIGALLINIILINHIYAQENLNVRLLGEMHNFVDQSYDVALSGDFAYISSGMASGLRVLDISDPSSPYEVGQSINNDTCFEVPVWMTNKIEVSGNFVYMLYFDGTWSFKNFRLYIYDVKDPSNPVQRGYITLPDKCTDLFINGNYAFISSQNWNGFNGLKIIDVTDPDQPYIIGSISSSGMPNNIFVKDNIVYIADNNSVILFDVSDPTSPVELGNYIPENELPLIHKVLVQGNYIFIIDATYGLRVLDASDYENIEEAGSFPHNQSDVFYSDILIEENLLYFLQSGDNSGKQMIILDVSNYEFPVVLSSFQLPENIWFSGFDYSNGCACIAAGQEGLMIFEISSSESIREVFIYDPHELSSGLAVYGNHAFISTSINDLVIYDITNPLSPIEINSIEYPDSPIKQISVWDNLLFVPGVVNDLYPGISVLDVSDPVNPREIVYWESFPDGSGLPFYVELYENYAYVSCAIGGVEVYNIEQIGQPVFLGSWSLWDPMVNQGFSVTNTRINWPYLYAPDRAHGLYVLDISDPSAIVEVASCQTPGEAMNIDISENNMYIYLADFNKGLRIIDVSNPLIPFEVGFYEENLIRTTNVAVKGDTVYVSDGGETGLFVFDVSDPTAPLKIGYHKTPGAYAINLKVENGLIHLLEYTSYEIMQFSGDPTGIENKQKADIINDGEKISVFPNPVRREAKIVFNLTEIGFAEIDLYNMNGQKLFTLFNEYLTPGNYSHIFSAKDLESGVYMLQLKANSNIYSYKIIVAK